MTDYRGIVDLLSAEIASGKLRPGDRLAPQREFADQHGIAASTASRVYGELVRRGLAVGEVGRGTFVRMAGAAPDLARVEPGTARVNLEFNMPVLPEQARLLSETLAQVIRRPAALNAALQSTATAGTGAGRQTVADFLGRSDWTVNPDNVSFTGNGRQALAAAIAALVPIGQRLGVSALTYPAVKGLASRLGVDLVPLRMDDEGLRPDALAAAQRKQPMRAIYCQPTLHNPLGMTMTKQRRSELADVLRRHDLIAIEDRVYAFLADDVSPLAAMAADHTVVVDSLSKRVAPGITLGFVVAPPALTTRIAAAVRSGAWGPSGFAMELCTRWMADGTAAAVSAAKRRDASARQRILRKAFTGLELHADPRAYHGWLVLSDPWRAETFVAAAAQQGIAITPAAAFAVGAGHAPNAVRLALASPTLDTLTSALRTVADLARTKPGDWMTE